MLVASAGQCRKFVAVIEYIGFNGASHRVYGVFNRDYGVFERENLWFVNRSLVLRSSQLLRVSFRSCRNLALVCAREIKAKCQ